MFKIILKRLKSLFNFILRICSFFIPFTFEKRLINKKRYKNFLEKIIYSLWGILGMLVLINLITICLGVCFITSLIIFSENIFASIITQIVILGICFNLYFFLIKSIELPVKYSNSDYYLEKNLLLLISKSLVKFIFGAFFLFFASIIFSYKISQNKIDDFVKNIKQEKIIKNRIEINNRTNQQVLSLFANQRNDGNCIIIDDEEICLASKQDTLVTTNNIKLNENNLIKLSNKLKTSSLNHNIYLNNELGNIIEENQKQKKHFLDDINKSNFFNEKTTRAYHSKVFWLIFILNVICLIFLIIVKSILITIDNHYIDTKTYIINKSMKKYLNLEN